MTVWTAQQLSEYERSLVRAIQEIDWSDEALSVQLKRVWDETAPKPLTPEPPKRPKRTLPRRRRTP